MFPAAGAGGSDSPPGEKPIPEATPDHSPIRPSYSARSPTPQVVDNLLGQLMEDVFTPRCRPQPFQHPSLNVSTIYPFKPSQRHARIRRNGMKHQLQLAPA